VLDKPLRAGPRHCAAEAMDTMQQLGSGDCRYREFLVIGLLHRLEIEATAFDGDEHARVDQRAHGFERTFGLLRAVVSRSSVVK